MKILVSFNKAGYEGACWMREIAQASTERVRFIPFNHGALCPPALYDSAAALDRAYQRRDPRVLALQAGLEAAILEHSPDVLFVTNSPPYHPDYLRTLRLYKVLNTTDDPGSTYVRTIPYLHAYDHVVYADPAYSQDFDMPDLLRYCGVRNADWLPIGVFDYEHRPDRDEATLFRQERDIEVVYVGSFFMQKLPLFATLKRAFGRRLAFRGVFLAKHNLYYNARFGFPGWVRRASFPERVELYQRARIGFNIHWNEFGLGNQRLYHLPANGVMQISDCASHLGQVYRVGEEVESYASPDELIDKIRYYLAHDDERERIARAGYRRAMADYRIATVLRRCAESIARAMEGPARATRVG